MRLSEFRRLTQHLSDATILLRDDEGNLIEPNVLTIDENFDEYLHIFLSKEINHVPNFPVGDSSSTCSPTQHRRQ